MFNKALFMVFLSISYYLLLIKKTEKYHVNNKFLIYIIQIQNIV